ncbi:MAG: hypothetical protein ABI891_13300 [Acidobacteriota bacterium]
MPPQRIFKRGIDVLAPVAARVRITFFGVKTEFCGDHYFIAQITFGDKFAD